MPRTTVSCFPEEFLPEIILALLLCIGGFSIQAYLPNQVILSLFLRFIVFAILFMVFCRIFHQFDYFLLLRRKNV